MKRNFLLSAYLAFCLLTAKAQKRDTAFKKEKINKIDIEVMYGHYLQDGNNSAVTGGIGTEKLTVYSPNAKIKKTWHNQRSLALNGGADIITSASTDNIDFVRSSASLIDARTYANLTYASPVKGKNLAWSMGTGFSVESDYSSLPVNMGLVWKDKHKLKTLSVDLQMFFDDLRWGRLNANYHRPVKLIYPQEVRDVDWFKVKTRQSYNLKLAFTQVINRRNIIGVFPTLSMQHGLLATPFHRVYFIDMADPKVENLPGRRLKASLGLKLNSFIGGRTILRNLVDAYTDDFGIKGLAFENETSVKLNAIWTLTPFARIYFQKGSRYFAAYKMHSQDEVYYTSDYDLSDFTTYKAGLGLRFAPFRQMGKNNVFNEWTLRYAYLYRTNGLSAHMITCVLNMTHQAGKKKNI
jgi:hypothetical protein